MSSTLTCKDIEKAILDGRRAFDFLQGDEDYKYKLGGAFTNGGNTLRAMLPGEGKLL